MYRYYVSFSHQGTTGFAVAALDVTAQQRIASVGDLAPVTADLTGRGYRNVTILAFSLYANPSRDNHQPRTPSPRGRRS